jgi:formate/nitrite transporter FocA (FNT family)
MSTAYENKAFRDEVEEIMALIESAAPNAVDLLDIHLRGEAVMGPVITGLGLTLMLYAKTDAPSTYRDLVDLAELLRFSVSEDEIAAVVGKIIKKPRKKRLYAVREKK